MAAAANPEPIKFSPRPAQPEGRVISSPTLPRPVTTQDFYLFAILQALHDLIAHEQENRAILADIRDELVVKGRRK
jgi:hypothetical protein